MKVLEDGSSSGFLKLTKAQEWISGDSIPPVNKKSILQVSFALHFFLCISKTGVTWINANSLEFVMTEEAKRQ